MPPQQQQQPNPFQNQQQPQQQRPQPLLQNPSTTQQQFPSHHQQLSHPQQQQLATNPNLGLQGQNPLGVNPLSTQAGATQANSLDSWLAIYAAALNPQVNQQQQQLQVQPQQDTNSITQQWAQWLKTAQMVSVPNPTLFSPTLVRLFRHNKLNLN